jgi:protein-L-isoaspartate(D-aspartate) O-methyltransferase
MIDAAGVKPGDRVLEIGAGSGYAAAVMSGIADRVIAVERHEELVDAARARLARLGYRNVEIVAADGSAGWPAQAPYDAILAAASGRHVPQPLLDQLAVGGTLIMPVGAAGDVQALVKVVRSAPDRFEQSELCPVRFVPLIGAEGWPE